jgi:hypothetical protein
MSTKTTNRFRFLLTAIFLWSMSSLALALDNSVQKQPILWTKQTAALPESITFYSGLGQTAEGWPVRAWYVDIDYGDRSLQIKPALATSLTGKQPVTEMARAANAYVAVNGGYFDMDSMPARTFSLVKSGGVTLRTNIGRITRRNGFYYVGRSAFGVRADRSFDIQWIVPRGDASLVLPEPLANNPALQVPALNDEQLNGLASWDVTDAIGGGPRLLKAGEEKITYDEEAFFGSGFRGDVPYPRTAVGYTATSHLVLFVVDGSRPLYSAGLTLAEVAEELKKLGCVDAMNLDGGGSSTLVVNGQLNNSPSGNAIERNVSSMLAIVPAAAN